LEEKLDDKLNDITTVKTGEYRLNPWGTISFYPNSVWARIRGYSQMEKEMRREEKLAEMARKGAERLARINASLEEE
jgi:hypothetical protein